MPEYVNNKRLREVVNLYNSLNIHDTGEWCSTYLQRLEHKRSCNKIDDKKFELGKDFITNKVKTIEELQAKYAGFTPEERRNFDAEFKKIKNELCDDFILIINGRINSFKLRTTLKNPDDIDDIIQDALICAFTYINRYDPARGSSAFAFITQIVSNSIILSVNQIRDRERRMISGLDYFDNINTIDDPTDGVSGLSRFIDN